MEASASVKSLKRKNTGEIERPRKNRSRARSSPASSAVVQSRLGHQRYPRRAAVLSPGFDQARCDSVRATPSPLRRNRSIPGSTLTPWRSVGRALYETIRRPAVIIHDAGKARDENPARSGSRALHGVPRNTISAASGHAGTVQGRFIRPACDETERAAGFAQIALRRHAKKTRSPNSPVCRRFHLSKGRHRQA